MNTTKRDCISDWKRIQEYRENICHGSMSHEVLFQAGTILFPVEFWAEMGYPYCVISARDSLLFRMRFSRLFFVYLQSNVMVL